jgi:hypothetical protein
LVSGKRPASSEDMHTAGAAHKVLDKIPTMEREEKDDIAWKGADLDCHVAK